MSTGKPEKPWKNMVPKPDPDRLLLLDPRNVGSEEKTGPGPEYAFDADRRLIDAVAPKNDFAGLLQRLKDTEKGRTEALFAVFGTELMEKVAEACDHYKDRAWEMIQICARQTGLSFPHVLQGYAELFTLCSRPVDKWAIVESHTRKMCIQQYSCSYLKAQEEAGLSTAGLPCQCLCLSAFSAAARLRDIPVKVELTRRLPTDKMCEFTFVPQ